MTCQEIYPFTAIIGQDLMKLGLILNAINPKIGGILIQGMKGTAKSTAVRALADILPEIEVLKNCTFNCNPKDEKEMCEECRLQHEHEKMNEDDVFRKKMSVINLPINATEDRVIGTIDINQALKEGIKALEPGILADANRNILYIDEVNLLADNVADVLLDSAAMGMNIIEREGISFHHPSNFILVGTMNPEEGNLRPQLLDRFGLSVEVERIEDIDKRVSIVKNVEEFQTDSEKLCLKYENKQKQLREQIETAKLILDKVKISDEQLRKIALICIQFQTDGHRADITIARTAKTIAAFNGSMSVTDDDIKLASKLALNHRMRRLPFEDEDFDEDLVDDIVDERDQKNEDVNEEELNENQHDTQIENIREETFNIDKKVKIDKVIKDRRRRELMNTSGQRILHPTKSSRGKYVGGEKPKDFNFKNGSDIAVNETLNKAALEETNRFKLNNGKSMTILEEHIQVKKRVGKSSYLIIFCVDASGSMGVQNRMKTVKGAIFSILQSNYIYRDKVSLIAFRKEEAKVILPPTRSIDLAFKRLKKIPTGGKTPLVEGLIKAMGLAEEEQRKKTGYIPLIILLTDARGNVYYNDAIKDVLKLGDQFARRELEMIIIDTENSDVPLGLCKKLAEVSNSPYYHLDDLNREGLNRILSSEGILDQ
ncbi:MAG: VWA domain-containing protein [Candidatus Lokiarchaeota archaeon]|nr:VWA domain-containing protein [Candidatus Lokiarchaeota archaeon]MBD3201311.1 VWA domain-containing protein [Candidatus Lokiarchaeota archaeon]